MLVVRVKRRRDELSVDQICVVEDSNFESSSKKHKSGGIVSQLQSQLQLDNKSSPIDEVASEGPARQLVLHKVTTLSSGTRSHLDADTKEFLAKGAFDRSESDSQSQQPSQRSRLVVTQNRSKFVVNDHSCLVVDMMQLPSTSADGSSTASAATAARTFIASSSSSNSSAANSAASSTPAKILDPTTRVLEQGILQAMQRADFNEISRALIIGANPNHQLPAAKGGYTALMAAAAKVNLRMVKRLLLAGVDPTLRCQTGQTAIDLIKESSYNKTDAQEIRHLLQSALIKHVQLQHHPSRRATSSQSSYVTSVNNPDYVVDVYCMLTDAEASSSTGAVGQGIVDPIKVEGLRIKEDGQVDLLVYDSDWSDLADDEDPDSNDERFEGNDYPEDEEDSVEEQRRQTATRARRRGEGQDSDEDDEDEEEEETEKRPGMESDEYDEADGEGYGDDEETGPSSLHRYRRSIQNTVRRIHTHAHPPAASLYDNVAFSGLEGEEDADVPLFQHLQRIGKVMPSHYLDASGDVLHRPQDTESLQALWGMAAETRGDAHEERIEQMRQRTGMVFGANPHEFLENGLAKFGHELSDDEADERILHSAVYGDSRAAAETTYAYDSELDGESDDEEENEDEEDVVME